jgi:transposase
MESTGVYWIPLYRILEARGIEVHLVNARHVKNVPGRKSEVSDGQWLQFLPSVGWLNGSFRPQQDMCVVRALLRHRDSLVRMAASHGQQRQKALNQMNVQIHHVISDLTGQTGLAMADAILAGQRDTKELAQWRDRRIKASQETIAKSLVGDYRPERLFTLQQALSSYRHGQQRMAECDQQISQHRVQLEALCEPLPAEPTPAAPVKRGPGRPRGSNTAEAKLRRQWHRIFGVDLT